MITRVGGFKTSDGKFFDDSPNAFSHELAIMQRKELEKFILMEPSLYDSLLYDDDRKEDFVNVLMAHQAAIAGILNMTISDVEVEG